MVNNCSKKKLSVRLPNYNHAKYLKKALEAFVTQSRPPDEIAIIDDGSTDNSVDIIKEYASKYPYIKYKVHEKNMGPKETTKDLNAMITGDYLYCASSTDYVLEGFFERAMKMAENYPDAGFVFGKIISVDANDNLIGEEEVINWQKSLYASPEIFLNEYLKKENALHCLISGTIFKRKYLNEIDYNDFKNLLFWSDGFTVRLLGLKYGACYIAEPCGAYRRLSNSYSSSIIHKFPDVVKTAAELMRSDKYKDIFPENYVKWFEKSAIKIHKHPLLYSAWWRIINPVRKVLAKAKME